MKLEAPVHTAFGEYIARYHNTEHGRVITVRNGDITTGTPLVRLHSACLFGEAFGNTHCECGPQLRQALEAIAKEGGVIAYGLDGEGRGAGLVNTIRGMAMEAREGVDEYKAYERLGLPLDQRNYQAEITALEEIGIAKTIRLITSNPAKKKACENAGYIVLPINTTESL